MWPWQLASWFGWLQPQFLHTNLSVNYKIEMSSYGGARGFFIDSWYRVFVAEVDWPVVYCLVMWLLQGNEKCEENHLPQKYFLIVNPATCFIRERLFFLVFKLVAVCLGKFALSWIKGSSFTSNGYENQPTEFEFLTNLRGHLTSYTITLLRFWRLIRML